MKWSIGQNETGREGPLRRNESESERERCFWQCPWSVRVSRVEKNAEKFPDLVFRTIFRCIQTNHQFFLPFSTDSPRLPLSFCLRSVMVSPFPTVASQKVPHRCHVCRESRRRLLTVVTKEEANGPAAGLGEIFLCGSKVYRCTGRRDTVVSGGP